MFPRIAVIVTVLGLSAASWPAGSGAQSLPFRSFSSDDGLAQSVVLAMAQERSGHLWIGTADGVSRFDGLEFENFGPATGLPHNVVRVILQDAGGAVWVGTDGGLARWVDGRWDEPFAGLSGLEIRCLAETPDGVLWVGTYGHGLARIDGDHLTMMSTAAGLVHERVRALLVDRDGRLWVGTFGGGLAVSVDRRCDRFEATQGLGDPFVRDLLELRDGSVLAATNGGVFRWTGAVFERLDTGDRLRETVVTSLLEDRRGRLWIGTRDLGACQLEDRTMTCFEVEDGLADSSLTDLLEDREGNLWFATFGGGISRLSSESFRNVTVLEGLPFGGVQAFAEIGGEIWMGAHGGGIARMTRSGIVGLTTAGGLPHQKVFTIWNDGDNGVWIGTLDGAANWKDGRVTTFSVADGLAHGTVFDIVRDGSGTLWFATLSGLTSVSNGVVHTFTTGDGLPDDRVNRLLESRSGGLWVATGGGVVRLRDGRIEESYTAQDGLGDGFVNALYERGDGILWIATAGGLSRLEGGRLETLTHEDGLSRDKCLVILEDVLGRLWIGTTRGIDIFDGTSFRSFTDRDGLPSSEVLLGAGFRDSSDRLWFGTVRGAVRFEPDAEPPNVPAPPALIVGVESAGEPLDLNTELRLEPHQNSLRFDFVGISLTYPDDVLYEYRLLGLDHRPRQTRARFVEYASVPPGEYTFEVRAGLGAETWSEEPAAVRFTITPPFWQTWWFRFVAGFGVALAMIATHLARVQTLRHRERRLEEEVRKRTDEVLRERLEVARKNQQLEVVNRIVQQINAELEFSSLLQSILEGVSRFEGATCALALVREGPSQLFEVQASLRWPIPPPEGQGFTRDQVENELLGGARLVAEGIHLCPAESSGPVDLMASLPRPCLVMTVDLGGEPAGYMIYGLQPRSEIVREDVEALSSLKEHVASAFIKGRILRELRQLNATKNEFLGIAAHDLRSPLGGILSYTGLLLRLLEQGPIDTARWRRFLGNVHTTADQLLHLVNDLLDVASIESGRVEVQIEELDLGEIVAEREALHLPAAIEKGIDLVVETPVAGVAVLGDRMRVGEVLDNLIGNALKFTAPGGCARIHFEVARTELVTHVADTGQGLGPEELEWVFSGRKLSARPTAGEPSTGLGLVIVKKLVELQNGRVWVHSRKGHGATFSFSLPRVLAIVPDRNGGPQSLS